MPSTITRYLSTFAERVESLSAYADGSYGTISSAELFDGYTYAESLTQWLTDGAAEIINMLPAKYHHLMASEISFSSGTPDILNTDKILFVTLDDIICREISPAFKARYSDSNDINYPTKTDPVYFIENNTLDVLPGTGVTVKYSEVQYPTIQYNHTDIGSINLTGVTATEADDTFTKAGHGLSDGDRVTISNVTGQSGLNGTVGIVESSASSTFKITSLDITKDITDCNITKTGGFPDEAVYLIVLYAAMKGLQYKMAFLMNETVSSQTLDAIVTLMDSAIDRIDADLWTDTSLFDDTDNSVDLVKVSNALDNAKTRIETTATSHLSNEDVELVKSAIDLGSAELQRAAAHLKEWDTVAATALKEAQGYADVIKTRMAKMTQEYGWYEKQHANLKGDYMRGLSALGARVGGQKN